MNFQALTPKNKTTMEIKCPQRGVAKLLRTTVFERMKKEPESILNFHNSYTPLCISS